MLPLAGHRLSPERERVLSLEDIVALAQLSSHFAGLARIKARADAIADVRRDCRGWLKRQRLLPWRSCERGATLEGRQDGQGYKKSRSLWFEAPRYCQLDGLLCRCPFRCWLRLLLSGGSGAAFFAAFDFSRSANSFLTVAAMVSMLTLYSLAASARTRLLS